MTHYRVPKTKEQLKDLYKVRDIEKELKFTAEHIRGGYFRLQDVDYIRWLCYAALERIKEKEHEE